MSDEEVLAKLGVSIGHEISHAFDRAIADLWMFKENLMTAQSQVDDVHPMNYLRINCTLQQYDEFLDQYGITEGDAMYLAPEDRVNIW